MSGAATGQQQTRNSLGDRDETLMVDVGGCGRYTTKSVTGNISNATALGAATGHCRTRNSHVDGDGTHTSANRACRFLPLVLPCLAS